MSALRRIYGWWPLTNTLRNGCGEEKKGSGNTAQERRRKKEERGFRLDLVGTAEIGSTHSWADYSTEVKIWS
jgi:hypothetical protein